MTITNRHNRLHRGTTEAIKCLKSWRKLQSIKPLLRDSEPESSGVGSGDLGSNSKVATAGYGGTGVYSVILCYYAIL